MARAFPSSPAETGEAVQTDDWQALRGELVALLDQVEGQYATRADRDPVFAGFADRMRDLRYKVADAPPADRQREALRSVKRQVDRFTERGELDTVAADAALQSAIRELRSRGRQEAQQRAAAPAPAPIPAATPEAPEQQVRGAELGDRLGRLEAALAARTDSGAQIQEVADHLAQLTQMVEMLAGAVGDNSQIQRLETQIASLSQLVSEGARADVGQLADRIDQVAATLDRLADLQVQQIHHAVREAETGPAEQVRSLKAVEDSLRNIYDRMDALEHNLALPTAEFERITAMLAEIGSRVGESEASAAQQDRLVSLIDALNGRVGAIEGRDSGIDALKADIDELRETVLHSVEPRFDDIQQRLGDIKDRLAIRAADPPGVSQLEAQIRQLVARMDQSAEQLAHIAQMRTQPTAPAFADVDALADLVASRTSSALARQPASAPTLSDESLAAIEARIGRLVEGFLRNQPVREGSTGFGDQIGRRDTGMTREMRGAALERAAAVREQQAKSARSADNGDAMPRNPAEERPLTDPGFADLSPVRSALDARGGGTFRPASAPVAQPEQAARAMATTAPAATLDAEGGRPDFDPMSVPRPPRPRSSFDIEPEVPFEERAAPAPTPAPDSDTGRVAPSSKNTFIEAARRAAQRQQAATVATDADSPIGRALARFQPPGKGGGAAAASAPNDGGPDQKSAKSSRGWFARKSKDAAAEAANDLPRPASAVQVEAEPLAEKRESFLVRNRRPILLAASLIAVSFMALNLVLQRMSEHNRQDQTPPAATNSPIPAPDSSARPPAAAPTAALKPASLVMPLTPHPAAETPTVTVAPKPSDAMTTASIDPSATRGYSADAMAEPMPPALARADADAPAPIPSAAPVALASPSIASTPVASPTGATATAAALPTAVASIPATGPATPTTLESPVKVELPPEAVGPLALRQAAADGDARAQFEVAAIYSEGHAVSQDMKQAATWYERAAAQGFVPAQYRLGNLYELGQGIPKDLEQARLWYQRAAEAGNRMAMHNLAALYAGGQFGKQDFPQAANWFEQAAQRDMKDSQFNLGMLYARGLGVQQDMAASYKWFALAAGTGDAEAAKSRDNIARSLDAETLKKAQAEVAAWKPTPIDVAANFAPIGTWQKNFNPGPAITDKNVVTKVQQALARLGFDIGPPSGKVGPKTTQAIKAFEHGTGMSEVGAINPRLLAVLGSQPV